jgi:hypothetical protein
MVAPQSLLAGMTPGNLKVPAGWTLVATQDFEESIPSSQYTVGTDILSTPAHTGTHSLRGINSEDGATVKLGVPNVQATEYYHPSGNTTIPMPRRARITSLPVYLVPA